MERLPVSCFEKESLPDCTDEQQFDGAAIRWQEVPTGSRKNQVCLYSFPLFDLTTTAMSSFPPGLTKPSWNCHATSFSLHELAQEVAVIPTSFRPRRRPRSEQEAALKLSNQSSSATVQSAVRSLM